MTKKILILILLLAFCAAFLVNCTMPVGDGGATAPSTPIQPRESFPRDEIPAQPGEGPEGLPTPTV